MSDYTWRENPWKKYPWEDWCWAHSVYQIVDALNIDSWEFMREICKVEKKSFDRVRMLALINAWLRDGKLKYEDVSYVEDEILDEIALLYEEIVDYIGNNKEYVAQIERAMLEEGWGVKDET